MGGVHRLVELLVGGRDFYDGLVLPEDGVEGTEENRQEGCF